MLAIRTTGEYVHEHVINCTVQLHEDKLLNAMRKIWEYDARDCEESKKDGSLLKLVYNWLDFRMRQNYRRLSSEIFDLEREITINLHDYSDKAPNENTVVKIPVFCVSETNKWNKEFKFTRPDPDPRYGGQIEHKLTLYSERRPMPPEIISACMQAQATAHKLYAEALLTYPVNEIVHAHPIAIDNPSRAKLLTLWQPKASDLRIEVKTKKIDLDPVLVLQWNSHNYLVTTWMEPGELPFDDIVNNALEKGQTSLDNIVSG